MENRSSHSKSDHKSSSQALQGRLRGHRAHSIVPIFKGQPLSTMLLFPNTSSFSLDLLLLTLSKPQSVRDCCSHGLPLPQRETGDERPRLRQGSCQDVT